MFKRFLLLGLLLVLGAGAARAAETYQCEIRNVELADSGLWYEVDCADVSSGIDRVRKINVRCRQDMALKLSFDALGATYFTIPAGQTYFEDGLRIPMVFYLQSSRDGDEAEIVIYR